jgi:glycosidase
MSWIDDAVIYQVNLRGVAAREPRNAVEAVDEVAVSESPLAYLIRSLPKIAKLGVNVIYLLPPYPIGEAGRKGVGSPYSSSDFMAVYPEYGTLAEIKELVRTVHSMGLKIIFDITPNHTARDHVWVQSNPEYYIRRDAGELFYDFDWSDVAKLDYHNPGLRRAMREVYEFWLSLLGDDGIDGFRLDMAHMISDLGFWDETMAALRAKYAERDLLFLAESYGTRNNLDLFGRGINAAYDDDFYKICQYLYAVDGRRKSLVHEADDASRNGDFRDKLAAFRQGGIAGAVGCALQSYAEAYPQGGAWVARYVDNHDEGRGLHRFGAGAVQAMMQVAFMSPNSIPFILSGQEFGAVNRPTIHERLGVCDKGPRVVSESGVQVLPGIEFEGNLFARTAAERKAWYQFYQMLIALRQSQPALRQGSFVLLDADEDAPPHERSVIAFERRLGDSILRCAVNLGREDRGLNNHDLFAGKPLYGVLDGAVLKAFGAICCKVL